MTRNRVESQALSSLRTSRATGTIELLQAVTMLREDDLDPKPKETAEAKAAEREDVRDILQAYKTCEMAQLWAAAGAWRDAHRATPARLCVWVWRPSATWRKSKTKEKARPSTAKLHYAAIVADKVGANRRSGTVQGPRQAGGTTAKPGTRHGNNGGYKEKPAPTGFDLNVLSLYLNYIQTERLFDKRYG